MMSHVLVIRINLCQAPSTLLAQCSHIIIGNFSVAFLKWTSIEAAVSVVWVDHHLIGIMVLLCSKEAPSEIPGLWISISSHLGFQRCQIYERRGWTSVWEWHLVNQGSPPWGHTQNKGISHYLQPASVWMCPKVEAAVTFPLRSQRENFPVDVTCGASAAQIPLALMEHNRMWKISRVLLASRNTSTLSKPVACLVWSHRHGAACCQVPPAPRNPSFLGPSPPETLPPSLR